MQPSLGNRLAVSAIKDLSVHTPRSIGDIAHWQDQCGFWLAELSLHAVDPEQPAFNIGLLKLALKRDSIVPTKFIEQELHDVLLGIALDYLKKGPPCRSN